MLTDVFEIQSTLPFRKLSDFEKPVAKWEWVCEMGVDPQESLRNVVIRERLRNFVIREFKRNLLKEITSLFTEK